MVGSCTHTTFVVIGNHDKQDNNKKNPLFYTRLNFARWFKYKPRTCKWNCRLVIIYTFFCEKENIWSKMFSSSFHILFMQWFFLSPLDWVIKLRVLIAPFFRYCWFLYISQCAVFFLYVKQTRSWWIGKKAFFVKHKRRIGFLYIDNRIILKNTVYLYSIRSLQNK